MKSFKFMFWELKCWPTFRIPWEGSAELQPVGYMMFILFFHQTNHKVNESVSLWYLTRLSLPHRLNKNTQFALWMLIIFFKNFFFSTHLHVLHEACVRSLRSISWSDLPGRLSLIEASSRWCNWATSCGEQNPAAWKHLTRLKDGPHPDHL